MSKLCLGTVQLGLKYGIKNELDRQPTEKESFDILKRALDGGINYFDTAGVYGNAETVLGDFELSKKGAKVISKLPANIEDSEKAVVKACVDSLKRLKADVIDGYLFHDAKNLYRKPICQGMVAIKKEGLAENIGVSIYEPEDALYAAEQSAIDYIQIPYNVLDQRLDECGFFSKAKENGKKVFARSAFLQGLLLMAPTEVPAKLNEVMPLIETFDGIANKYRFSRLEAALLYSYCHSGIDFVVFGVDTVEQLKQILLVVSKKDVFTDCFKELHGRFTNVERKIIIPSLW